MSATRLLVLGVVRGYRRAHGYLIGSELLSWGADEWANVKWGSIYHALRQLSKDGLLRATEIPEWPGRTDYELTDNGDAEFFHLLKNAIARPTRRPDTLAAALALLPALDRADAIALLRQRLDALEAERDKRMQTPSEEFAEDRLVHLKELPRLAMHAVDSEMTWTLGLLHRLESGEYLMVGEAPETFGTPGCWE